MAAKFASTPLAKGFNEELTCPVCLELFKIPKTLPCLHTFCEECLKGTLEKRIDKPKGVLECPTCRTQHDLPPKGVEGFTTNFTTTNLVEILTIHGSLDTSPGTAVSTTAVLKCEDGIDDNPAATKCLDCNHYLCEDCTADHKRRRGTRNHKIATLAEIKEGGAKKLEQKRYCAAHEGEELKLYCRTCQEVICRDCTIVTHKQHDYTFIKDVREELTKKMESLMARVEKKKAEYQSRLDSNHQDNEKEQQKLASKEASVKMFFDTRIAALQRRKISLLTHLAQASAVQTKQLLADEESLQISCTQLTSALSFAQQQLSSASSTDLAMMSKQVIQQLEALSKHKLESTPCSSFWEISLSEDNPLKSKVVSFSDDEIINATIVSDIAKSVSLGKNSFRICVINVPKSFNLMNPTVTVSLSSGHSCPVEIVSTGNNTWSVTYFITTYPQLSLVPTPGLSSNYAPPPSYNISVTVKMYGRQVKNSPFQIWLRKGISVGTRVKLISPHNQQQCTGTVVDRSSYRQQQPRLKAALYDFLQSDNILFVRWDDNPITQLHDIEEIEVLK